METEELKVGDWVVWHDDFDQSICPDIMVGQIVKITKHWMSTEHILYDVRHIVLDPEVHAGTDFEGDEIIGWLDGEICKITEEEAMFYRLKYS